MKTKTFYILLITSITCSITSFAIAQSNPSSVSQPSTVTEPVQQQTITRKRAKKSIIETIWQLLTAKKAEESPLISRSKICEISPGLLGETNRIYSDRPLFLWKLWQEPATNLKVNLYSPFSLDAEQEILWTQATSGASQNILYTGEPLQPGKIYDWEIVTDASSHRRRIAFEIIEGQERDRISEELAQLETDLTYSGATKAEIILAKANYFAQQDLWSDSLQQLYSLETISTEDILTTQEMMSYVCQSE